MIMKYKIKVTVIIDIVTTTLYSLKLVLAADLGGASEQWLFHAAGNYR